MTDYLSWNYVKAAAQERSPWGFRSVSVDDLRNQTSLTRPFGDGKALSLVCLDTETTSLSSDDRIIEVAALKGEEAFVSKFNPEGRTIALGAMRVHGITDESLKDKPLFRDRAAALMDFLDGSVWCAHNAPFDARFLAMEFARASAAAEKGSPDKELFTRFVNTPFMDTRKLGPLVGLTANCHLAELCVACGESGDRRRHSAVDDAELLETIINKVLA